MSAAEIIKELSKLTEAERREVRRKLAELDVENEGSVANPEAAKQVKVGKDVMRRYRNTLRELSK
jgi:hypothetical protein